MAITKLISFNYADRGGNFSARAVVECSKTVLIPRKLPLRLGHHYNSHTSFKMEAEEQRALYNLYITHRERQREQNLKVRRMIQSVTYVHLTTQSTQTNHSRLTRKIRVNAKGHILMNCPCAGMRRQAKASTAKTRTSASDAFTYPTTASSSKSYCPLHGTGKHDWSDCKGFAKEKAGVKSHLTFHNHDLARKVNP